MRVKTNCPIEAGPEACSSWYLTKAIAQLGHELVNGYEADLVLNIDGLPLVDRLPGAKYFFWDCDSFMHEPILDTYDQIFIGGCPEDLDRYPEGTVYVPHAFDDDYHYKRDVEQVHDIVMIGNMTHGVYEKRNKLVAMLSKKYNVLHKMSVPGDEYATDMSKGKLILNQSLGEKNIPIRFFEGMAIGALLENYNDNLDSLAQRHVHYIPYTDEDICDQIDYYLANDKEREELAKRARKHALENHTYKHRADRILSYV